MAESFDNIKAKMYYRLSSNWNEDGPVAGDWEYWDTTVPRKEGQVARIELSNAWCETTYKSDRYVEGRGSAVALIQSRLNSKRKSGAPSALKVDGVFGSATKSMVLWFQRWVNTNRLDPMGEPRLKVDGVVGSRTWGWLAV